MPLISCTSGRVQAHNDQFVVLLRMSKACAEWLGRAQCEMCHCEKPPVLGVLD